MFHDFHTFDLKVGLSKDSILSSSSVVLSLELQGFVINRITHVQMSAGRFRSCDPSLMSLKTNKGNPNVMS